MVVARRSLGFRSQLARGLLNESNRVLVWVKRCGIASGLWPGHAALALCDCRRGSGTSAIRIVGVVFVAHARRRCVSWVSMGRVTGGGWLPRDLVCTVGTVAAQLPPVGAAATCAVVPAVVGIPL